MRFDSVQPRYNLLFREFERELFPLCLEEGIGVIPYNPIAGGMLSGKYDRSQPPVEGTRFTLGTAGRMYQDRYWHENVFDTVDAAHEGRRRGRDSRCRRSRSRGCSRTRRSPRRSSVRAGPNSSTRRSRPSRRPLDADLVDRLNELTAPYRRGDAPRCTRRIAPVDGYGVSFTHQLMPGPVSPVAFAVSRKHGLAAFGMGFGILQIHTVFFNTGS